MRDELPYGGPEGGEECEFSSRVVEPEAEAV